MLDTNEIGGINNDKLIMKLIKSKIQKLFKF